MPRKPQVRSRRSAQSARPSASTPRRPAMRRRSEPLTFQQCQSCGAPVEPQFGLGDDSWCPSCHAVGTVAEMYGQYHSPRLYAAWATRQAREKRQEKVQAALSGRLPHPLTPKEELMKRTKTHTGTFHCPTCFIEVELVNEESLKCDRCRGPLAAGSLDEVWADEDAEED